jgi:hypothetical protein
MEDTTNLYDIPNLPMKQTLGYLNLNYLLNVANLDVFNTDAVVLLGRKLRNDEIDIEYFDKLILIRGFRQKLLEYIIGKIMMDDYVFMKKIYKKFPNHTTIITTIETRINETFEGVLDINNLGFPINTIQKIDLIRSSYLATEYNTCIINTGGPNETVATGNGHIFNIEIEVSERPGNFIRMYNLNIQSGFGNRCILNTTLIINGVPAIHESFRHGFIACDRLSIFMKLLDVIRYDGNLGPIKLYDVVLQDMRIVSNEIVFSI